jgi:hypothetical protein
MNTREYETGTEDYYSPTLKGPILPDRLTNIHPKNIDHPTPYAKGTYEQDTTAGAITMEQLTIRVQTTVEEEEEGVELEEEGEVISTKVPTTIAPHTTPEEHVTKEETHETNEQRRYIPTAKRQFSDDSALDYIPREEFSGTRPGYVYRLGSKGIGYYEDIFGKTLNPITLLVEDKESTSSS